MNMKKVWVYLLASVLFLSLPGCSKQKSSQKIEGDILLGGLDEQPNRGADPIDEPGNLLTNPGFESGTDGWVWFDWSKGWNPFSHDTHHAYEGRGSIHFSLKDDDRQTSVWGAVQELTLETEIPECVEGYYYVDDWVRGEWKQYLQLVIIDLSHTLGKNRGQAQLRYVISGASQPPLNISNARYLFVETVRRETPVLKKWTKFSINPRVDFQKSWQYIPTKGATLRVLFEARYDLHRPDQAAASGEVYFDNLYMGPKTASRCAD